MCQTFLEEISMILVESARSLFTTTEEHIQKEVQRATTAHTEKITADIQKEIEDLEPFVIDIV
jgi:hypothetical protein